VIVGYELLGLVHSRVNALHRFFQRYLSSLLGRAFLVHSSTERLYRISGLALPKDVLDESPHLFCLVPTRRACTLNQLQRAARVLSLFARLLVSREA
jgi:hypothetical protein